MKIVNKRCMTLIKTGLAGLSYLPDNITVPMCVA